MDGRYLSLSKLTKMYMADQVMVKLIFYEKPGCINNAKQKVLLKKAGYQLEEKNLLTEPWTSARLLAFFHNLPVNAWFNQSAPAVKGGEIDPNILTAEQAIHYMLADPILIRRPLMEVGNTKIVGFDNEQVRALYNPDLSRIENLESCPKQMPHSHCDTN